MKKDYEWLKEVDKFALTNAIYNMDTAYQKFFREHAGYPKFKYKHDNGQVTAVDGYLTLNVRSDSAAINITYMYLLSSELRQWAQPQR